MSAAGKEMDVYGAHEKAAVDAPPPELVKHIDEKILKHSHDADAAMKAFEGYEGQTLELSEETNRRLLRKIDLHLMPVSLCIPSRFCMCAGTYSTHVHV
jgi:ACS family allantoate permease-like MFS transporter